MREPPTKTVTHGECGHAAMRDLGEGKFADGIASTVSDKSDMCSHAKLAPF